MWKTTSANGKKPKGECEQRAVNMSETQISHEQQRHWELQSQRAAGGGNRKPPSAAARTPTEATWHMKRHMTSNMQHARAMRANLKCRDGGQMNKNTHVYAVTVIFLSQQRSCDTLCESHTDISFSSTACTGWRLCITQSSRISWDDAEIAQHVCPPSLQRNLSVSRGNDWCRTVLKFMMEAGLDTRRPGQTEALITVLVWRKYLCLLKLTEDYQFITTNSVHF